MDDHLDNLKDQARSLPQLPGVYLWKDGRDRVLYVGKAIDLRARVTSYFSTANRERRIRDLVRRARSIDHQVTPTELDALFRESALIKELQPPFNRALRSPRKFFYFKLAAERTDPYVQIVREQADDGSLYFGPFRTAGVARETLQFVHAVLPLRKCTAVRPRCKPCLYFAMHTCAAPALDDLHRRRHEEAIEQLGHLLDGRTDRVIAWLEAKRDRLSEALLFERAAEIQDRLRSLHELTERQSILEAAVLSRCLLVSADATHRDGARLLLVAHGRVVSMRDREGADARDVERWIRAHDPILRSARAMESELDAASVLERWIAVNRQHVRWVAIPQETADDDLRDRVCYVLATSPRPLEAVPVGG